MYLDEITGGRGVVFATGTPISNSMVELYNALLNVDKKENEIVNDDNEIVNDSPQRIEVDREAR